MEMEMRRQFRNELKHIKELHRLATSRLVEFLRERIEVGDYIEFKKGKMSEPSTAIVLDISDMDGRIRIQNEKTGTKRWIEPECLR